MWRKEKDVDGFHPLNMGRLARLGNDERLRAGGLPVAVDFWKETNLPCTPLGCMHLLDMAGVDLYGKHAVGAPCTFFNTLCQHASFF